MSDDDRSHFDDPALKANLKRLYEPEKASAALRARVSKLTVASQPLRPTRLFQRPLFRMAVAAALLVAGAGVIYRIYFAKLAADAVSQTFLTAMVDRHDGCVAHADHHGMQGENYVQIGHDISARLGHGVLSCALPGWKFRGASICPVNSELSCHLVFDGQNGDTLSILSVAGGSAVRHDGWDVETVAGHPLAALVRGQVIYCLVCKTPTKDVSTADLQKLLKDHEGEIVTAKQSVASDVELLHDDSPRRLTVAGR